MNDILENSGFSDPVAARRRTRICRLAKVKRLIIREVEHEPKIIRELVEAHYEEVVAFVGAGCSLDRNTIENALKKVAVTYAGRGDVAHHQIAYGRNLSLHLFEAIYGVSRHPSSPYRASDRDADERNRWRLARSAPSNRQRPMNMVPSTMDKVRAALRRDLRVGHVYLAAFVFCAMIWTFIGLLAIGATR